MNGLPNLSKLQIGTILESPPPETCSICYVRMYKYACSSPSFFDIEWKSTKALQLLEEYEHKSVKRQKRDCVFPLKQRCPVKELTYEKPLVRINSCGHYFHIVCLQKWIDNGRHSCPICRQQIDELTQMDMRKHKNNTTIVQSNGDVLVYRKNQYTGLNELVRIEFEDRISYYRDKKIVHIWSFESDTLFEQHAFFNSAFGYIPYLVIEANGDETYIDTVDDSNVLSYHVVGMNDQIKYYKGSPFTEENNFLTKVVRPCEGRELHYGEPDGRLRRVEYANGETDYFVGPRGNETQWAKGYTATEK